MAYDKKIISDSVIQRLVESQGLFNAVNRSFDGLVREGAGSVDIPKLADVVVKKSTATPLTDASRKKAKADTTMVNVPLIDYAVPLAEEILGQYESNGMLIREYLTSASLKLQEQFDTDVIAAAQTTTDVADVASGVNGLNWSDIVEVTAKMDKNKVPKSGRLFVVSAELAQEFYNIDVVKSSLGYNQQFLQSGTLLNLLGMKFYISGLVPTVTAKNNIVGIYGPGLAFILARFGEVKTAWDTTNLQTVNDMLAHAGVKLLDDKFAVVRTRPTV